MQSDDPLARAARMGEVQWSNTSPGERRQGFRRVVVRPGQKLKCLVLSRSVTGVFTHFIDGRTQPCRGSSLICPGCHLGQECRWRGYVAALIGNSPQVWLPEITAFAVETCPDLLNPKCNLRGRNLMLERRGDKPQSPVWAVLEESRELSIRFPDPDVKAVLIRMWAGAYKGPDAPGTVPTGPTTPINGPALGSVEQMEPPY